MAKTKKMRRYDVNMIRDFLEHLKWEMRVRHFECTHEGGGNNDELTEQLMKYMQKWNSPGLLRVTMFNTDAVEAEEIEAGKLKAIKLLAGRAEDELTALEYLDRLFEEALECSAAPGLLGQELVLRTFLDSQEDDDDSDEDENYQD